MCTRMCGPCGVTVGDDLFATTIGFASRRSADGSVGIERRQSGDRLLSGFECVGGLGRSVLRIAGGSGQTL